METLPTISRSLTDFARTSPFFVQTEINANQDSALSVAGRNTRYNNIQIDGAVNNDVFGLAESGTPGGPAGTQPVSIDAIQELQLVVSPVDVRQAGFSGGGMNAITKSGSNTLHGLGVLLLPRSGPGRQRHRRSADCDVQRQGGRLYAGRPDRKRTRRSSSAPWSWAAATRRRDIRSPATPASRSAARPRPSASSTSCRAATTTTRAARRVHPQDRQRQDPGQGRLQHRAQPADRSAQLRRRLQRCRHAKRHDLQLPGQFLSLQQHHQHHGGAVQLDVRHRCSTSCASLGR